VGNTSIQPGGESAHRVNPPAPAAPSAASSWTEQYKADLTSQGAHSFADGVPHAIEGVDWESQNAANADAGSPSLGGSGLEILLSSAGASNRWFSYDQTGPAVMAALSDLVSGYGPSDTIAVQALVDLNITNAGTGNSAIAFGLLCSDGAFGPTSPNPGGRWHYSTIYTNTATNYDLSRSGGGPLNNMGNPYFLQAIGAGTTRQALCEMIIFPGGGWVATVTADTDFIEPLTGVGTVSYGSMQSRVSGQVFNNPSASPGPSFDLTPARRHVGMMGYYQTLGGARDATITLTTTAIRVMKRA